MKKYVRLRSTSSFPEHCEGEVAPTALSLDDDARAPRSLKLSPPAHHDRGDDVSSSHKALADALKKLSSLRETHHDVGDSMPRGFGAAAWGARVVRDSDAGDGEPHSPVLSGNRQRPRSGIGPELQSSSFRSSSSGGAGVIRTEASCTHTSHFTHRRSSSMHDVSAARPAIGGSVPSAKGGFVPRFLDDAEKWAPPPQLRTGSAAAAPSVRRPIASSCLWEESEDGRWGGRRAGAVQSLRYDRLPSGGSEERELQSQSVREGAAHAQAIAAMARAYAEKYGVAQAVVECVACGRGLGVIVQGNSPGSYDSSFCRSCRPPLVPAVAASASASAPSPSSSSWKKGVSRGMMHYCRKLLLRVNKKPSHKYTMV